MVRVLLHPDRLCDGDLVPAAVTSTEPIFTGPEYDSDGVKRPVEYFNEQFDDAIKENIVEQSNLYATQVNPNTNLRNGNVRCSCPRVTTD